MPLVLGVDSSTQATKVEVRDADSGRLVADGRAPHPPASPPRSEQDPEAWLRALADAMDIAGVDPVAVAAVAVAGQQHGLVVLDTDGRPLRPAKLWNDTESAPDAVALLDRLDGAGWARACGSVPVPAMTVTKLAWLRRVEPTAYERVASVLLPHDFVTRSLVGTAVTDQGDASGTGYWSPADRSWRHDLLALVDPERDWAPLLPRVLGPTEAAGSWRGALVGPGTGDNMAAALGLGLGPGDVAFSIGTSGTVFAVTETPTADPSGAVAGFAGATGHYLPLVCTLNAAKVTDAAARLLGVDHAGLDALAEAAPAGAGGLVLVPYLDGERTPNRPLASGTLAGIRSDVSREQFASAAFEGVVCGLLDGFDALAAAGVEAPGRVFLIGGGARSAAYRRVLADLLGRPVTVPATAELVALGACAQAAAVLHGRPPGEVVAGWALGPATVVEPDGSVDRAAVRAAYAEACAVSSDRGCAG